MNHDEQARQWGVSPSRVFYVFLPDRHRQDERPLRTCTGCGTIKGRGAAISANVYTWKAEACICAHELTLRAERRMRDYRQNKQEGYA
ncbi:hypothetical protein DUZ99_12115 [Xylanibacillus composti]|uniref:Uncharacterized protein n=1 Tax=Xylanibacillus composti TaxID=1572762 RepID=A0A8J4H7E1_9BACL|nr:hypothetical protein [Xylanibacillus composti]GIQ71142.1 hypothetical protein XYCOK13_39660 [Xylanibacillus composti]